MFIVESLSSQWLFPWTHWLSYPPSHADTCKQICVQTTLHRREEEIQCVRGRTGTLHRVSWEVYLHDNRGCKTLRMYGEQTGVGTWACRSDPTPEMKTKWMKDGMIKLENEGHRGYSLCERERERERKKMSEDKDGGKSRAGLGVHYRHGWWCGMCDITVELLLKPCACRTLSDWTRPDLFRTEPANDDLTIRTFTNTPGT